MSSDSIKPIPEVNYNSNGSDYDDGFEDDKNEDFGQNDTFGNQMDQMENELKQKQKTIDKYKIQQQGEMNAKRHYELEMERHKHFFI